MAVKLVQLEIQSSWKLVEYFCEAKIDDMPAPRCRVDDSMRGKDVSAAQFPGWQPRVRVARLLTTSGTELSIAAGKKASLCINIIIFSRTFAS